MKALSRYHPFSSIQLFMKPVHPEWEVIKRISPWTLPCSLQQKIIFKGCSFIFEEKNIARIDYTVSIFIVRFLWMRELVLSICRKCSEVKQAPLFFLYWTFLFVATHSWLFIFIGFWPCTIFSQFDKNDCCKCKIYCYWLPLERYC